MRKIGERVLIDYGILGAISFKDGWQRERLRTILENCDVFVTPCTLEFLERYMSSQGLAFCREINRLVKVLEPDENVQKMEMCFREKFSSKRRKNADQNASLCAYAVAYSLEILTFEMHTEQSANEVGITVHRL